MAFHGYPSRIFFRMRLLPEPKGEMRPRIMALDWNKPTDASLSQFESLIAIGSISRTRIFARLNADVVRDKHWQMMFNIRHPQSTRSKAIQWNPSDGKILAVGTDDGTTLTVEIVHWDGERFKKCNRIQVSTRHELVSVCWETTGKYMLAVLGPIEGTDSKMVVMKNPTKAKCITSIVNTGYKGSFSAVFRPYCHYIMSCSADVGTILVWRETESNVWIKFSSIRIGVGISKMIFNADGFILAGFGNNLRIWDCGDDHLAVDQRPKLTPRDRDQEDDIKSYRGVSLAERCTNLSSIFVCCNDMILTGSSKGSMCLHGVPTVGRSRKLKTFKVQAFEGSYVQFMYPQGEITCVQGLGSLDFKWLTCGGTDGIVTIWEFKAGNYQLEINRNPRLEEYCYEPKYQSLDDSIDMQQDDVESVLSSSTDRNDELELLLTVKAKLGELELKQNKVQKMIDQANDRMTAGLEIIANVAKDLHSAKVQNDEINTSVAKVTELLTMGL